MKEAEKYNINKLILAHGAISYTTELYEEEYIPKTISTQGKLRNPRIHSQKKEQLVP